MKKFLVILLSWVVVGGLFAQNKNLQKQRKDENRLDSIWRAENIWNLGVLDMSGKPFKDLTTIEQPQWVK